MTATDTAIADLALLSDCHSAALVDRAGTVVWMCQPRFDSPSVFGALLDPEAGHFSVAPASAYEVSRRYLPGTLVLETTFHTPDGTLILDDVLATGANEGGHDLGLNSPRVLVRRARCVAGRVEVRLDVSPRSEYGLVVPLMMPVEGGVRVVGGPDRLSISTSLDLETTHGHASGRVVLSAGERLTVGLQHRTPAEPVPALFTEDELNALLQESVGAWRVWSEMHQNYDGFAHEQVLHAGRVLYGLTYRPTGAVVAAPTTSLPEEIGGERNWDYRYTWVRDASFTLSSLWVAACPHEAAEFFDYLSACAASQVRQKRDLQIMFGIGGEHDLHERELDHLSGFADSRPVRVGNGAWQQRQLDVYGELVDAAYRLREQLHSPAARTNDLIVDLAESAAARWRERDQGIWEIRGEPQDFLYSKLMCWVALDRAVRMAQALGVAEHSSRWTATAEEIRNEVLTRGWSERRGAYAQALGSDELDASVLMMPIVGIVAGDEPRMLATLDVIERDLTDSRGLVLRYETQTGIDGVAGDEGSFLLCTYWLAQAQARARRVDAAVATFERATSYANDLGLFAEEVDSDSGALLGNFPQAFSHIGLVNAAFEIDRALQGT